MTEIGIFSTVISNSQTGQILENRVNGFLARTKDAGSNEGGVAAGFAVIDSVYPVDIENVN
jgi:hypothetical protein